MLNKNDGKTLMLITFGILQNTIHPLVIKLHFKLVSTLIYQTIHNDYD